MKRSSRIVLFAIAAVLPGLVAFCLVKQFAAGRPALEHRISGRGVVLDLASGLDPHGEEIMVAGGSVISDKSGADLRVVALDAKDGRVRWERRWPQSMASMINREPVLAFDEDRNILSGWKIAAVPPGATVSMTKISSLSGEILWEWRTGSHGARTAGNGHSHLAAPAASSQGKVLASGIWSGASPKYERFVALLDAASGREIWFSTINEAADAFDRRLSVFPLSDGDAIIFCPPPKVERSQPWLIMRISGRDGGELWRHEVLRHNDRNLPGVWGGLNELEQEFVVVTQEVIRGRWKDEVLRLKLGDGTIVGRSSSDFSEYLQGGIWAGCFNDRGTLDLHGRRGVENARINWLRWDWDAETVIPFPRQETTKLFEFLRVELEAADGKVARTEVLARQRESPQEIALDPLSHRPSAMLLLGLRSEQSGPRTWKLLGLDGDRARQIAKGKARHQGVHMLMSATPSGRIVTCGNPQSEEQEQWAVQLW